MAHKSSRNEHLCARKPAAGHFSSEGRDEMERSAASEGVPAALRLSKSTQSADKVHFSDSVRVRYHGNSDHNQSGARAVDQIDVFFITSAAPAQHKS